MRFAYKGFIAAMIVLLVNLAVYSFQTISFNKQHLKNALDAAARAGATVPYTTDSNIHNIGTGFGVGDEASENISLDRDKSLNSYYRILFSYLKIDNDSVKQAKLKEYITMKAIIGFDRLMIADKNDNWLVDIPYEMEYGGTVYRFTLSDDVYVSGSWRKLEDIGMDPALKKSMLTSFIKTEFNRFINTRIHEAGKVSYDVQIALTDSDQYLTGIKGVSFVSFLEGIPIPSMNPLVAEKYYTINIATTELIRK